MIFNFLKKWRSKRILFETDPQYREFKIIWRIFEEFPLFTGLADGLPFPWFAINIPMDLVSKFRGDFDIIACLVNMRDSEKRYERIYKTWEVKTVLMDKAGKPISLKAGKTKDFIKQLKVHRNFGSPSISLLEVYLCHIDFMRSNPFPPPTIHPIVGQKTVATTKEGFGYQILPFGHDESWDMMDYGLLAYHHNHSKPPCNIIDPKIQVSAEPFNSLTKLLNDFHDAHKNEPGLEGFHVITFCRKCKKLVIIGTKNEFACMYCGEDLST